MAHYRDPNTAPRDGTIIVGLFARKGKRATAKLAAFDVEAASVDEPRPTDPDWVKESEARHAARLAGDPVSFFRPLSDDADTGDELGRMVGWRPVTQ